MPPTLDIPLTEQLFLFGNCNMVPDQYDTWQRAYDTLAAHVYPNEPHTLTYYFGIPLHHASNHSATTSMLAFEAYRARTDLYDVHLKSQTMTKEFLPVATKAMSTGLDLTHFQAVGGFLDNSGIKTECGIMNDIQVTCVKDKRDEVLGALRLLCRLIEGEVEGKGEESEVLTFIGMKSLDNGDGVRIFVRYRSQIKMEAWARGPLMTKFWESVKDSVASMDQRPYVPNGKGWLWK